LLLISNLSNIFMGSVSIRCRNLQDYMVLAEKVKKMFHEEGIHSTTIQPEFVELDFESVNSDENCILDCPPNDKDDCAANTCCGPTNSKVKKREVKVDGALHDSLRIDVDYPDITPPPSSNYSLYSTNI